MGGTWRGMTTLPRFRRTCANKSRQDERWHRLFGGYSRNGQTHHYEPVKLTMTDVVSRAGGLSSHAGTLDSSPLPDGTGADPSLSTPGFQVFFIRCSPTGATTARAARGDG